MATNTPTPHSGMGRRPGRTQARQQTAHTRAHRSDPFCREDHTPRGAGGRQGGKRRTGTRGGGRRVPQVLPGMFAVVLVTIACITGAVAVTESSPAFLWSPQASQAIQGCAHAGRALVGRRPRTVIRLAVVHPCVPPASCRLQRSSEFHFTDLERLVTDVCKPTSGPAPEALLLLSFEQVRAGCQPRPRAPQPAAKHPPPCSFPRPTLLLWRGRLTSRPGVAACRQCLYEPACPAAGLWL